MTSPRLAIAVALWLNAAGFAAGTAEHDQSTNPANENVQTQANAAAAAPTADDDTDAALQRILNEPVPDGPFEEQACLDARRYKTVRVVDQRRVIFYGRHNTVWLNQMPNKCPGGELEPGLKKNLKIVLQRHGNKVCDKSRIQLAHPAIGFSSCMLGTFSRISPEQAELILAELEGRPTKR